MTVLDHLWICPCGRKHGRYVNKCNFCKYDRRETTDVSSPTLHVLSDVLMERERQDKIWGEQNHNPYIYLAILLEELGELAQAVLHTQFGGPKGGWVNVRKEAVQVAAVAFAIIECLDRGKWRVNDVNFNYQSGGGK